MRRRPGHTLFAAAAVFVAVAASGQTRTELDDLQKQMDALQKGQQEIQKELGEIRSLLTQLQKPTARPTPQVPPDTVLDLAGRPSKGAAEARLAVIEFLDYQ